MDPNRIFGVQDDGKTAGLCSYFFVLGWSVSYFGYHKMEKTSLSSFHLRQTLLLYISYIATRYGVLVILSKLNLLTGALSFPTLVLVINVLFAAFWVTGLISASKGEEKHIPLIGKPAQVLFQAI